MFFIFERLGGQWRDLEGHRMFVSEFYGVFARVQSKWSVPIRGRHAALFAGTKEVHLYCFARADRFDDYADGFEQVLASFRGPTLREWLGERARGLLLGVIALTAMVAAFLRMTRQTRKRAVPTPATEPLAT
jgi:hypothetical protein